MTPPAFWFRDSGWLAAALSPLGALYAAAARFRRARATPRHAPVPVFCVGNAGLGGAGKTPTAAWVAEKMAVHVVEAHIVSRGYGGSEKGPHRVTADDDAARVGDEPLLLSMRAPVWVSRDRAAGAIAAAKAGAQAVILDDGHQNPTLHKDFTILAVDAGAGFGNGRVFPAGPLREPAAEALARADMVFMIGDGAAPPAVAASGKPTFSARLRPVFVGMSLTGAPVVAFAGIGRPEKFFETLRRMGARLVQTIPFPDHHVYDDRILRRLIRAAESHNAMLVTTEKDIVKLPRWAMRRVIAAPVRLALADEAGALAPILALIKKY